MKPIIIAGGGGFAREIIWLAREVGTWELLGVLSEADSSGPRSICGVPVLGGDDVAAEYPDVSFVAAVGNPRLRQKVVRNLKASGVRKFATLIHPSVLRSEYVNVGEGSMICAGCILTTQIELAEHVVINLACTVGHDVRIGSFANIAPGVAISGSVEVGSGADVGTGAVLREGVRVGSGAVVGMGSVVTKGIGDNTMAFGNPAKEVRRIESFQE